MKKTKIASIIGLAAASAIVAPAAFAQFGFRPGIGAPINLPRLNPYLFVRPTIMPFTGFVPFANRAVLGPPIGVMNPLTPFNFRPAPPPVFMSQPQMTAGGLPAIPTMGTQPTINQGLPATPTMTTQPVITQGLPPTPTTAMTPVPNPGLSATPTTAFPATPTTGTAPITNQGLPAVPTTAGTVAGGVYGTGGILPPNVNGVPAGTTTDNLLGTAVAGAAVGAVPTTMAPGVIVPGGLPAGARINPTTGMPMTGTTMTVRPGSGTIRVYNPANGQRTHLRPITAQSTNWKQDSSIALLVDTSSLLPGKTSQWVAPSVSHLAKGETLTIRNSATGQRASYHIDNASSRSVIATITAPWKKLHVQMKHFQSGWHLTAVRGIAGGDNGERASAPVAKLARYSQR